MEIRLVNLSFRLLGHTYLAVILALVLSKSVSVRPFWLSFECIIVITPKQAVLKGVDYCPIGFTFLHDPYFLLQVLLVAIFTLTLWTAILRIHYCFVLERS